MWPANSNGISAHVFITRVVLGGAMQQVQGRRRTLACPSSVHQGGGVVDIPLRSPSSAHSASHPRTSTITSSSDARERATHWACFLNSQPVGLEHCDFYFYFLRFYLLLGRGEGRVKERGKHQCVVASHTPPTGDLAQNPGMCPDWESNLRPFGSWASAQSTEPHQPRQHCDFSVVE